VAVFVGDVDLLVRCCLGCTVLFLFFRLEEDFDAAVASVVLGVVVAFGSDSLLAALLGSSGMVEDSRAASACKRGLLLRSNSKPLELTIVPPTAAVMMV